MLQTSNRLGISVYVSTFDTQKDMLENLKGSGYYVFTSFHIQEEFNDEYILKAKAMCNWLNANNYKVLADVSHKTQDFFGYDDIAGFAKDMGISILRLDYGFSEEEMLNVSKRFSVSFNASIVEPDLALKILNHGNEVFGMHNFYPRPETGLDDELFKSINNELRKLGSKVFAFIPGDKIKRGPIYGGLPTLEKHRGIPPFVAYLDLAINHMIDGIFVGDIMISDQQFQLIKEYIETGAICIPVNFKAEYEYLYNQSFTIRIDSPAPIMRLQESREFSCTGKEEQPFNTTHRNVGSITMDNKLYGRYSGEIQIVRHNLPQDNRVNVIGEIQPEYQDVMNCIKNGKKIKFIKL